MKNSDLNNVPAGLGVIVLSVLFGGVVLAIYPGWPTVGDFLTENIKVSSNAPAWVQAIGSVAAIYFSGRFAIRQMMHSEELHRKNKQEDIARGIWACQIAAKDAHRALNDLVDKISRVSNRPPSSSLERLEGLEQTIRTLLASQPHPKAVHELLVILTELAYSRVAIREFDGDRNRSSQTKKAIARADKVRDAASRLSLLYSLEK